MTICCCVPPGLEGAPLLEAKVQQLLRVLSTTTFHQACVLHSLVSSRATLVQKLGKALTRIHTDSWDVQALVFCNSQPDAQALADRLNGLGYPAAFVSGSHAQVRC